MPWIRRPNHSTSLEGNTRIFWIAGVIVAFGLGLLISYEWWGSTASVVELVEKELTYSRAMINRLAKRVEALESIHSTTSGGADVSAAGGVPVQKAMVPVGENIPQRSQKKP